MLVLGVLLVLVLPAAAGGAASQGGGKLVFESDRAGAFALFAMRPDGAGVVALGGPAGAADGDWSPDGHRLAFAADPDGDFDPEIFIMNADGTGVRQLTNAPGPDIWPDWFPDGRRLAFTSFRSGKPDIYVMNIDGSAVRQVTDDPEVGALYPQVSSNGKVILHSRGPQFQPPAVAVVNADGSGVRVLTDGSSAAVDAVWTNSGTEIVFSSDRSGAGFEIYRMRADGSDVRALTASAGRDYAPAVSPDGKHVAWTKRVAGNDDIWVMGIDGADPRRLTFEPSFEGFPDWHQGHLRG